MFESFGIGISILKDTNDPNKHIYFTSVQKILDKNEEHYYVSQIKYLAATITKTKGFLVDTEWINDRVIFTLSCINPINTNSYLLATDILSEFSSWIRNRK